jgi:hypothetical protein
VIGRVNDAMPANGRLKASVIKAGAPFTTSTTGIAIH